MGIVLSIFRSRKLTTRDTLEKIEQELQSIEEKRWDRIRREKLIVQLLTFISITTVIVSVFIIAWPGSHSWQDKTIYSLPVALLSFAIWQCKKLVQWYSIWSRENEEGRLRKLRKEKRKILDNVCETESYKVATELLEKYDSRQLRRRNLPDHQNLDGNQPFSSSTTNSNNNNNSNNKLTTSPARTPQRQQQANNLIPSSQIKQDLVQSLLNQSINLIQANANSSFISQQPMLGPLCTPGPNKSRPTAATQGTDLKQRPSRLSLTQGNNNNQIANTSLMNSSMALTSGPANQSIATSSVQGRPVRPVLSKERSFFERAVDWVVSDGPSNRFALICKACHGHNGMCLEDEFFKLNFRCCYCYNLNLAEHRKPPSPQPSLANESTITETMDDKKQADHHSKPTTPISEDTIAEENSMGDIQEADANEPTKTTTKNDQSAVPETPSEPVES